MNAPSDTRIKERIRGHGLVLYDGECGFCQFWVQFILKRDAKAYFLFAPLQATWARELLGIDSVSSEFESVVLVENGAFFRRSTAALKILYRLGGPWKMAGALLLVPANVRDWCYDFVAKRRKRIPLGRYCRILRPEERARFFPSDSVN